MPPMTKASDDGTPLLMIGATLPRTGTSSTKIALQRLGHKVFHAHDLLEGNMIDSLGALARAEVNGDKEGVATAMKEIVDDLSRLGYTGVIDWPLSAIYLELLQVYPNAKVLLSVKDDNERAIDRWVESAMKIAFTSPTFLFKRPFKWLPIAARLSIQKEWLLTKKMGIPEDEIHDQGLPEYGGAGVTPATAKALYYRYLEEVKANVPEEKLVIYNVKQGWAPLCEHFLRPGYTCPSEEPFPHSNALGLGYGRLNIYFLTFVHYTWPIMGLIIVFLMGKCIQKVLGVVSGRRKLKTV